MTKLMMAAAATAMLAALVAGQWGSALTRNSGAAATSPAVTLSDTIKIGGGFALTGAESALDVPAYNGATLAVEGDQRRRRRQRPADRDVTSTTASTTWRSPPRRRGSTSRRTRSRP